ncbi:hypothetical protein NGM37_59900 [Streptomyces sp. TRM76130]|nr:hypothetical protein [Streptomyces sp. TRM76130]
MSRTHRRTALTALVPLALTAAVTAALAYPTDADGTVVADAATTLTVAPGAPVPPPESSPDGVGGQE